MNSSAAERELDDRAAAIPKPLPFVRNSTPASRQIPPLNALRYPPTLVVVLFSAEGSLRVPPSIQCGGRGAPGLQNDAANLRQNWCRSKLSQPFTAVPLLTAVAKSAVQGALNPFVPQLSPSPILDFFSPALLALAPRLQKDLLAI